MRNEKLKGFTKISLGILVILTLFASCATDLTKMPRVEIPKTPADYGLEYNAVEFEATDGELVEVDTEKGELSLAWKDEDGETGIQRISFDSLVEPVENST